MLLTAPFGFAHHKIVLDSQGKPVDYIFLEINAAFEKLTGLKAADILKRSITEAVPAIKDDPFDWIGYYGGIALNGGEAEFEQFSAHLGRWYKVTVHSPERLYFSTIFIDITRDKLQSEELMSFFTVNLDLLCIADLEGNFIKTNQAWTEILGYSQGELAGRKFLDFVHPQDLPATLKAMAELGNQQDVLNFTNRYLSKDGSYRFIEWRSHPHNNLIYAAARDITERIEYERAIKQSLDSLSRSEEIAHTGSWSWDVVTDTFSSSLSARRLMGFTPEEKITIGDVSERIHPDDRLRVRETLQASIRTGEPYRIETQIIKKDNGEIRIIESQAEIETDTNGRACRVFGVNRDITEEKLASHSSEIRLKLIEYSTSHSLDELLTFALDFIGELVHSPIGFYHFVDADQKTLSLQQWSTATLRDYCHAAGKGAHYSIDEAGIWVDCVRERKPVIHNDYEAMTAKKGLPQGHARLIREMVIPVLRQDKIVAILGVGNKSTEYTAKDLETVSFLADITWEIVERKRTDQDLRLERERLQNILFGTNAGTWEWNIQTGETIFNERWAEIIGYTLEEISPVSIETWLRFAHPDDQAESNRLLEQHFAGELDSYEFSSRMRHKNGEWIWILDRGKVVSRTADGKPLLMYGTHQDITGQKRATEALAESEAKYRLLTEFASDVIWVINLSKNCFTYISPSIMGLRGLTVAEAMAEKLENSMTAESLVIVNQAIENNLPKFLAAPESGAYYFNEIQQPHKDGRLMWVEVSTKFRYNEAGEIEIVGVSRNIDERKKLEAETISARNEADRANKAKSEFLANMSHEIRTPLNGIIGFTELLKNTPLNKSQKLYTENVLTASHSLLGIINDILDLSKIEAGKMELDPIRTDIIELAEQATDIIKYHASKKGLELLLNIDSSVPRFAVVDPLRLKQILINLLSNAVKFTETGEVELKLSFSPSNGSRGDFNFEVRDTGIGITEEQQRKLFNAFTQADSTITRRYGGTGLGLTISDMLARKMNAHIKMISASGRGSTFSVCVNTGFAEGRQLESTSVRAIKRALIADDNASNRLILEHVFKGWGISTETAANGQQVLDILKSNPEFDVLIIDYHMPVMNGLETVRKLRTEMASSFASLPVLILHSSAEEPPEFDQDKNAAVIFWIPKPVKSRELLQYLSNLGERAGKRGQNRPKKNVTGDNAPADSAAPDSATADSTQPDSAPPAGSVLVNRENPADKKAASQFLSETIRLLEANDLAVIKFFEDRKFLLQHTATDDTVNLIQSRINALLFPEALTRIKLLEEEINYE